MCNVFLIISVKYPKRINYTNNSGVWTWSIERVILVDIAQISCCFSLWRGSRFTRPDPCVLTWRGKPRFFPRQVALSKHDDWWKALTPPNVPQMFHPLCLYMGEVLGWVLCILCSVQCQRTLDYWSLVGGWLDRLLLLLLWGFFFFWGGKDFIPVMDRWYTARGVESVCWAIGYQSKWSVR